MTVGDQIIKGVLGLIVVGILGFVALDVFSYAVSSPVALEPGDPLYKRQSDLLPTISGFFPLLVGGGSLVLAALVLLARRGR